MYAVKIAVRFIKMNAFFFYRSDEFSFSLGAQQPTGSVFFIHESAGPGSVDLLAGRLRGRVRHTVRRGQILSVRMGVPKSR